MIPASMQRAASRTRRRGPVNEWSSCDVEQFVGLTRAHKRSSRHTHRHVVRPTSLQLHYTRSEIMRQQARSTKHMYASTDSIDSRTF